MQGLAEKPGRHLVLHMRRRRDARDVSDVSKFASNSDNDKVLDDGPAVGALLRANRLRIGEDLHDIAAMLHIRYPYLEAIEEGRYKDLPGPTYAVGFVRTYADNLGLDSDEVVRRFKTETSGIDSKADLRFPSRIPEGGVPGGAILFVGAMVALLAYGGWYLSTSQDTFLAEVVPPVPERLTDKSAAGGTTGSRTSTNDATQATAAPAVQETAVVADSSVVATGDAATSDAPITSETSQGTDLTSRAGSDDRPDDAAAPSTETVSTPAAASPDQAATAAQVTTLQTFQDLFSSEALRPMEQIAVTSLTIMFTDLKGPTAMNHEVGDAPAFGRVKDHFTVLRQCVSTHHGSIVKTIGDAVMAAFVDPAEGVAAALDMMQEIATYNGR